MIKDNDLDPSEASVNVGEVMTNPPSIKSLINVNYNGDRDISNIDLITSKEGSENIEKYRRLKIPNKLGVSDEG